MIPGKAFTRNGASADGDYVYLLDENLFTHGRNFSASWSPYTTTPVAGRFPPTTINVIKQDEIPDSVDLKVGSTEPYSQNTLVLPFRFPLFMKYGGIYFTDSDLVAFNSGFTSTDVQTNYGHMIELFVHDEHVQKYMDRYNEFWGRRSVKDAYLPIESQPITSPDAGLLHMYLRGKPAIEHYPTSCSLQALKSGSNNYIYITYVYSCRVSNEHTAFWAGENHFNSTSGGTWLSWMFTPTWYINTFAGSVRGYSERNIEYRWSVPIVTQWEYDSNARDFSFVALSAPHAVYSNKINSSIGTNEPYNTKVIPYDTTQIGNIGSLDIPSSNRCVASSYLDSSNDRLVVAAAYGSEENTWPDFRVDVSYHNTSGNLTFVPTKQATFPIEDRLKSARQYGYIDNINNIDITKWQNYYIMAISYDLKSSNNVVSNGTLLLKINSVVADPSITWFRNFKGAAFGAVQGLSSGSML